MTLHTYNKGRNMSAIHTILLLVVLTFITGVLPTALWGYTLSDTQWWVITVPTDTLIVVTLSKFSSLYTDITKDA